MASLTSSSVLDKLLEKQGTPTIDPKTVKVSAPIKIGSVSATPAVKATSTVKPSTSTVKQIAAAVTSKPSSSSTLGSQLSKNIINASAGNYIRDNASFVKAVMPTVQAYSPADPVTSYAIAKAKAAAKAAPSASGGGAAGGGGSAAYGGGGGSAGGYGGGAGGFGGMASQLAGRAAQTPQTPAVPEKPPRPLRPTEESASGKNYKDPRLSSPSFMGGSGRYDDDSHGKNVLGQLAARAAATPQGPAPSTTPTTPTPKPKDTKPTTKKPTTPQRGYSGGILSRLGAARGWQGLSLGGWR